MASNSRFHWNLGGWLGSQLGGSCWMLIAGVLAIAENVEVALVVLALFVAVNVYGFLLWTKRGTLSAYAGIQLLLPVLGIAGIAATWILDRSGLFESIQTGATVSADLMYAALLLVVMVLMISFWWQERQAQSTEESNDE